VKREANRLVAAVPPAAREGTKTTTEMGQVLGLQAPVSGLLTLLLLVMLMRQPPSPAPERLRLP
jgi:hypothetical protein